MVSRIFESVSLRGVKLRLWVQPVFGQWGIALVKNITKKPEEVTPDER